MPNHVTTRCTVTGPALDIDRFLISHCPEGRFSLDTVIPMPEVTKNTSSGSLDELGMFALRGYRKPAKYWFQPASDEDWLARFAWLPDSVRFGSRAALLAYLEQKHPAALDVARTCLASLDETGFPDWYEWALHHWGTKWDAYEATLCSQSPGAVEFTFDTAWSFPEPVFRRLAKLFPALVFSIVSFDEGWNFGCEGQFNGADDYRRVDATSALYMRVYGKPPEEAYDAALGGGAR